MVGRQWGLGGSGLKAAVVAPKLGPKCAYKSALWQLGNRFRLEVVAADRPFTAAKMRSRMGHLAAKRGHC